MSIHVMKMKLKPTWTQTVCGGQSCPIQDDDEDVRNPTGTLALVLNSTLFPLVYCHVKFITERLSNDQHIILLNIGTIMKI